ncbi:ABC transporter ATP-binding protein [Streptococcus criceti]|uniref:Putative hemin import ATP-binding protein HrtA n=1 Tax=Streptococcus criceti HS-6 TaxID=873449 RepID=G5JPV2_STRCG|nr:ABC transporter ATP-binding protein [Streptococcus criceti]EHI73527.1 ABC transporter, ATP-binding protein [Streptococcus criceti HS-6]SUN43204.1 ABC transporter ATP-binding protein [Streptococcus criceti]
MAVLSLKYINKYFGKDSSRVHVLKNLDFTIDKGKLILVLGPSGSGKSTFLTIAGGLQTPDDGSISINGQDILKLTSKERDSLRLEKIGFVLQNYSLVPYLTAMEQLQLVDQVKKEGNLGADALVQLLKQLGIYQLKDKYPDQLSGGQRQRLAIARALYTQPEVVLADEPTAALDSEHVKDVGELFANLAHQGDKAIVIVTHDIRLEEFADEVYHLNDGVLEKA